MSLLLDYGKRPSPRDLSLKDLASIFTNTHDYEAWVMRSPGSDILAQYIANGFDYVRNEINNDEHVLDHEMVHYYQTVSHWSSVITNMEFANHDDLQRHNTISNQFNEPTKDQIDLAREIRKYYKERYLMRTLKGQRNFTDFTKDMYNFCTEYYDACPQEMMGIMIKLPFFYEYDRQIDELVAEYDTDEKTYRSRNMLEFAMVNPYRFKVIKRTTRQTKNKSDFEYWLSTENRAILKLSISTKNPLYKLLEKHIKANEDTIQMTGLGALIKVPGHHDKYCAELVNWDIV